MGKILNRQRDSPAHSERKLNMKRSPLDNLLDHALAVAIGVAFALVLFFNL